MKFKVGDRITTGEGRPVHNIVDITLVNNKQHYIIQLSETGTRVTFVVIQIDTAFHLESVVNSPLFKVMNEVTDNE